MKLTKLLLPFSSDEITELLSGKTSVIRKRYPDLIKENDFDENGVARLSEPIKSYVYCKHNGMKLSVNGIRGNCNIVGACEFKGVKRIKNDDKWIYEWIIENINLFDKPKPFENAFEGVCRFLINGCCTDKRKLVCKEMEGGCEGCFIPLDGVPKEYAYVGGIIDDYVSVKE